ncbi:MAG: AAA family ATPase [Eubacteriales bacterium]
MNSQVFAVAGKGGVGKTSISAAIVKYLLSNFPEARILAIDADPAIGLETALGIKADYTVDDIRKEIAKAGEGDSSKMKAKELLGESRFKMLDAMIEANGYSFLAVGRPETAGCYCGVNTYLKKAIQALAEEFDYVVIDGEAGVEQINRRVMDTVTHLFLVSDASRKGTDVIKTIHKVASTLGMTNGTSVIINRLPCEEHKQLIDVGDLEISAYIQNDEALALTDIKGESVLTLNSDSALMKGVYEAMDSLF